MKITEDHWIDTAVRDPLPGGNPMPTRRAAVMHFTGGWGARYVIPDWRKRADGVCAHVVIDRNGEVYQCRPFNRTCGHAGKNSTWRDPSSGIVYKNAQVNQCTIGIELANCGELPRDRYPVTAGVELVGQPIPRLEARHKNGGGLMKWEVFPNAQLVAATQVVQALIARYQLDDVTGHDIIAPSWKTDPGPAFPMETFRQALGFPRKP